MSKKIMDLMRKNDTVDVALNPIVLLWLKEKAKRDPAGFARLVQDNRVRIKRLLGGHSGSTKEGKSEWSVWIMEEAGSFLFVCSSAEGTVYRINYPGGEKAYSTDRKMGSAMTAFLERFIQDLAGFGPLRTEY